MAHPSLRLPLPAIGEICRRHGIRSLALFGSALREDFHGGSDVDLLVEFDAEAIPDFTEFHVIKRELEGVLGRAVDLLEKSAVERSRNYIRRRHILEGNEILYVA